ncbi:MAG TPA: class I SAM-dependent methyltransferase [Anaerolineales bacterium]|nr:class I SAM-dependent methyltransferase [Anaerolineales bacterium]
MKTEIERVLRPRAAARKSYNAISYWYDLFTGSEKHFTDIGIQMLNVRPEESILEIGCGTGHSLVKFETQSRGGKVIAIDISEGMLKAAHKKIRGEAVQLCQADAVFIPSASEQFDTVFLSFTLELFDTLEIPNVLNECHRVLKPIGRIGIVSLAKQNTSAVRIYEWFHRLMPILVDCRPIYLQATLQKAGFQVKESKMKTMWGLPVEIVTATK